MPMNLQREFRPLSGTSVRLKVNVQGRRQTKQKLEKGRNVIPKHDYDGSACSAKTAIVRGMTESSSAEMEITSMALQEEHG